MTPQPPVRYYDARKRRRAWVAPTLVTLVLLVAGVVTWAVLRTSNDEAGLVGTGPLPSGIPSTPASTPDTVAPDSSRIRSVVMIGDSITRASEDAIRFTLTAAGIEQLVVDGRDSRRIDSGGTGGTPESGMSALRRILKIGADPDAWVIALGTNDVGQYGSEDEYRALIREVLDMLPADRPLVWVDVYRYDHIDDTFTFDRLLREELATRPDATVVSWFDQAATRTQEILRSDQVHPNKEGTVVFARLVAQGLDLVT